MSITLIIVAPIKHLKPGPISQSIVEPVPKELGRSEKQAVLNDHKDVKVITKLKIFDKTPKLDWQFTSPNVVVRWKSVVIVGKAEIMPVIRVVLARRLSLQSWHISFKLGISAPSQLLASSHLDT